QWIDVDSIDPQAEVETAGMAAGMGDDDGAGTAVRSGHGLRYPHDRRAPCLPYVQPGPRSPTSPTGQTRTMTRPCLVGMRELSTVIDARWRWVGVAIPFVEMWEWPRSGINRAA